MIQLSHKPEENNNISNNSKNNNIKTIKKIIPTFIVAFIAMIILFLIAEDNYLLFHSIAEFFSIIIAFGIFIIVWNARKIIDNHFYLFIGIAFLFIGGLDFIHTLSYKGMGVFPQVSTNIATQLWIASRYLQSFSFLTAFLFLKRKINTKYLIIGYAIITTIIFLSIFYWMNFPTAYDEQTGLTSFKIISEYLISFIFLCAIILIFHFSDQFNRKVRNFLIISLLLSVGSEMAFTLYHDPYGHLNILGHIFKIISFYFIYKALVEIGLNNPTDLLFHNLKQREIQLEEHSLEMKRLNELLIKEINERKKIEKNLRKQEERYHSTLENMIEGCQIIDYNWRYIYLNKSAVIQSGKTKDELLDHTMMELFPGIENTQLFKQLQKCMKDRTTKQMENEFTFPTGEKRVFELSIQPVPEGLFIVSQDITERKNNEKQIRQLNAQILYTNKELEAFSYSVSHDLQAPLRSIGGFSQIILEDYYNKLDDQGKDYLKRIVNAVDHMSQLINDLLRLSRINRSELKLENVDLSSLVQITIQALSKTDSNRKVDVSIEENITTVCDKKLIEILIHNVLENAWKYTSKNPKASIQFGVKSKNKKKVFYISDNGVGFNMEYADKLFKPFQRLHEDKDFSGSGIGLAIVQRIIKRHHGEIWAESIENKGTTFYFTLPVDHY